MTHLSQTQRREASEMSLVEATLSVVADQGVSAATFEVIGKQAGLSRGLASQHFGSKRKLVEAVIDHLHRKRELELCGDQLERMSTMDALALFVAHHVSPHVDDHRDARAYFSLLAASVADVSDLRELFAASHDRVRTWLRALLQRGQARGEVRPGIDPDGLALTIGSLLLGANMQRLVNPETNLESVRVAAMSLLSGALALSSDPNPETAAPSRPGRVCT